MKRTTGVLLAAFMAIVGASFSAQAASAAPREETVAGYPLSAFKTGKPLPVAARYLPTLKNAPTLHYVEGQQTTQTNATGATSPALAQTVYALPYNFTFDVSYGIWGRDWLTGTGKACKWLAVTLTSGTPNNPQTLNVRVEKANGDYHAVGPEIGWPLDGQVWVYCWTGLVNGQAYEFFTGFGGHGNGAWAHGSGSVTSS